MSDWGDRKEGGALTPRTYPHMDLASGWQQQEQQEQQKQKPQAESEQAPISTGLELCVSPETLS